MNSRPGPLWDIPTRICHWSFVFVIAFSWWSAENDHLEWHTWSGFTLLALLLFRIVWGFIGSDTARFNHFLRGPSAVINYAKQLTIRNTPPARGHNPMGGWSVVVLLTAMVVQVVLGLFAEDVDGLASGPLSYTVSYDTARWAAEIHEEFFNVLMFFVVLHVVFVFFYLFYKKDNLIVPMIIGTKSGIDTSTLRSAPLWLAVIVMAIATAFVWWLVN